MKRIAGHLPDIVLLLLSIYVSRESFLLGLGTWRHPGSGFILLWSAVILGALVLIDLGKSTGRPKIDADYGTMAGSHLRAVIITLASIAGYVLVLETLGFLITTSLFVGILLKGIERKSFLLTSVVSLIIAVSSYVAFKVLLTRLNSVPALFTLHLTPENTLTPIQTLSLPGNPLDLTIHHPSEPTTPQTQIIISLDSAHRPGSTTEFREDAESETCPSLLAFEFLDETLVQSEGLKFTGVEDDGVKNGRLGALLYGLESLRKRDDEGGARDD